MGTVDTNQLKNNMADISPNGRFIAAAAFTADVKVSCVAASLLLFPFILSGIIFLQYQRDKDHGYFLWLTFLLHLSYQCTGIVLPCKAVFGL